MTTKPNTFPAVLGALLLAFVILFAACKDAAGGIDSNYEPPDGARGLAFSHNSGLYSNPFQLMLAAPEGSTIYYSTDGSDPLPEYINNPARYVFEYTGPVTVKNRNGQPNVLSTKANLEQMYPLDDDAWSGFSPNLYFPTKDQVPKATVIRAMAVDAQGYRSKVITKTYFIGSNLNDYKNHPVISIVTDPDNLLTDDLGILVRGGPGKYWWDWKNPTKPIYNFLQSSKEWEREAFFELFDGSNRKVAAVSTSLGIRVHGGYSRVSGQKSFNMYFREEYGINTLQGYNLIPTAFKYDRVTPMGQYKSFMLRSGGNDTEGTKFWDLFAEHMVRDRICPTQSAVPGIVYLNGEYWGPYNIQEKYGDNYFKYKFGVDNKNVISFKDGTWQDGLATDETYFYDMRDYYKSDLSNSAVYAEFCNLFDIDNFIDYWAIEMYLHNVEWPESNFWLWRTRVPEANPYGVGDTKWRYVIHDLDATMGANDDGALTYEGEDVFYRVLADKTPFGSGNNNARLFRALVFNEGFSRQFVNTMMDLYNVNFHPDVYTPILNSYIPVYKDLMGDKKRGYNARWGAIWGEDPTGDWIFPLLTGWMKGYLTKIRPKLTGDFLPNYFGGVIPITKNGTNFFPVDIGIRAGGLYNVTLSTAGASGATIKLNTVTPKLSSGSWTGKYYKDNPITLTAIAPNGYKFSSWTITNADLLPSYTAAQATIKVNITGNATIKANYTTN